MSTPELVPGAEFSATECSDNYAASDLYLFCGCGSYTMLTGICRRINDWAGSDLESNVLDRLNDVDRDHTQCATSTEIDQSQMPIGYKHDKFLSNNDISNSIRNNELLHYVGSMNQPPMDKLDCSYKSLAGWIGQGARVHKISLLKIKCGIEQWTKDENATARVDDAPIRNCLLPFHQHTTYPYPARWICNCVVFRRARECTCWPHEFARTIAHAMHGCIKQCQITRDCPARDRTYHSVRCWCFFFIIFNDNNNLFSFAMFSFHRIQNTLEFQLVSIYLFCCCYCLWNVSGG